MTFDRRSFIKAAVASSLLPFTQHRLMRALAAAPPLTQSYLLLQGLFFMEFDGSNLIVATPGYDHHVFYTRGHGKMDLIEMPSLPNYSDIQPGNCCGFPDQIIKFSYAVINQPQGFLRNAGDYRCKMVLPCPKAMFALRKVASDAFAPDLKTNVGKNLVYASQIATVLCLAYDPVPNASPWIASYYAQHASLPKTPEVNLSLQAGKKLCGKYFDLALVDSGTPMIVGPDNDQDLPSGLDHTDEYNIPEILNIITTQQLPAQGAIPPCTCGQSNSQAGSDHKETHAPDGQKTQKKQPAQPSRVKVGGDASSCPMFGVHH